MIIYQSPFDDFIGVFVFENSSYRFSEVSGQVGNDYVTVKREKGSHGRINLHFSVHNGTAFHGVDYTIANRTVEFQDTEVITTYKLKRELI